MSDPGGCDGKQPACGPSRFQTASDVQPRLQWRFLGKQPRSLSDVRGNGIKAGTGGSQAGAARSAELAASTCISSRLPVRFSPVRLNLPDPVEQIHFFVGLFNLLGFETLPLLGFFSLLAGHCSIRQPELLHTKGCIHLYLGTEET